MIDIDKLKAELKEEILREIQEKDIQPTTNNAKTLKEARDYFSNAMNNVKVDRARKYKLKDSCSLVARKYTEEKTKNDFFKLGGKGFHDPEDSKNYLYAFKKIVDSVADIFSNK